METISDYILTFFVNSLWQVTVVALVAAGCGVLLRKSHARLQHILWVLALLMSVGLPLWSLLQKPEYKTFSLIHRLESGLSETKTDASTGVEDALLSKVFSGEQSLLDGIVSIITSAIVIFYLLHIIFRSFQLIKALMETRRIRRTAYRRELTASITSAVSRCRDAFAVKHISVFCSRYIAAPFTMGNRRPIIVLPENLFEMNSEELLVSAIGHETAHIKRKDFTLNLVYQLLYLLISFHPAAALIRNKINETRENACDEMVARLINADVYARSLVNLAAVLSQSPPSTFVMSMMNDDILEKRVKRLVAGASRTRKRQGKLLLTLAAFIFAASCGIASVFSFNFVRDDGNKKIIGGANDIAGTWRGSWQGLPGATLVIKSAGSEINGTVTFYLLKKNQTGLEVADDTGELPLIEPKLNNNVLTFKIKRRLSDDTIRAEMNFAGENEAVLKLESDEIKGGTSEIKLNRDATAIRQ